MALWIEWYSHKSERLIDASDKSRFIYEEGNSRQEMFLSTVRNVIAPANWKKGPDTMFVITNILIVSTTPLNHMRMERFFDSLPQTPDEQSKAWIKTLEEKNGTEKKDAE